jgi:S-adenosylmethionine decarboxylase
MTTTVGTKGRHVLAEYWGCNPLVLANKDVIKIRMEEAALAARATIVASVFHQFTPSGVSGVVVVAESHLSIHTWPEEGYASADFYTCGDCEPERALEFLQNAFGASRIHFLVVDRGLKDQTPSFRVIGNKLNG